MSSGLTLCEKFYSFDWIRTHYKKIPNNTLSSLECRTLEFCGQWLSGRGNFEVRTSGSTGKPRPIVLTREQMSCSARLTGEALGLIPGDSALVCLSPEYIAGIMMLVRGMELGLKMTVVAPTGNPFASIDPVQNRKFDFTAMVPLQLETILNASADYLLILNRMKVVLVGSAPVSLRQQNLLQSIVTPVYLTFGMTETVTHIALRRLNGPQASARYEVLPSIKIGRDHRGCLTVKSSVTNHKKITTNDRIVLESQTHFQWLGRIDNVINSGGVKVQPEKIEQALSQVLYEEENGAYADRDLFVTGLPDDKLGEMVTAVVEGEGFPQKYIDRLGEKLTTKLDKYEIPRRFVFVNSLVRTKTGKIDRRANIGNLFPN